MALRFTFSHACSSLALLLACCSAAGCGLDLKDEPISDEVSRVPDDDTTNSRSVRARDQMPVAILTDPAVRDALAAAERAGHEFTVQTGTEPPDITGYYTKPERTDEYVASGDGSNVGGSVSGMELGFGLDADDNLEQSVVTFGTAAPLYVVSTAEAYRGTGSAFTIYMRSTMVCHDGGSDYTLKRVGLTSGKVDARTGDLIDVQSINVTLSTEGKLTSACTNIGGDGEHAGGWSMYEVDRFRQVAATALQHMCIVGDAAYPPTGTWTNKAGEDCTCQPNLSADCG